MATSSSHSNTLRPFLEKEKLHGGNYLDWLRTLRIVLRYEQKEYVIDRPIPIAPRSNADEEVRLAYEKHVRESNEVASLMLVAMTPELQKSLDGHGAYEIASQLRDMFQQQAAQERFQTMRALLNKKMKEGEGVSKHVLQLKVYVDQLAKLGLTVQREMVANIVLSSLTPAFEQFIMNYHMHNMDRSIMELHGMLKTVEENMTANKAPSSSSNPVLAIREGGVKKKRAKAKGKGKAVQAAPKPKAKDGQASRPTVRPEDATCYFCGEKGHMRSSCPKYKAELRLVKTKGVGPSGMYLIELNSITSTGSWVLDTGCGTHICKNVQGLKASRRLEDGELELVMGNNHKISVERVGSYDISFPSNYTITLLNCCYSPLIARNIISFHALYNDGFDFNIKDGVISVSKNSVFVFNAYPYRGVYETNVRDGNKDNSIMNVDTSKTSGDLDKMSLWHNRLGHINKTRITKLQTEGILEPFDHKSDGECESCLKGKMTKAPFSGSGERGKDLLDIVHTDVCGPFRSATRGNARYFVTFIDDMSRFGYVFLMKHKDETPSWIAPPPFDFFGSG